MQFTDQVLKIQWQCQLPAVKPQKWHQWTTKSLPDDPLEQRLEWPKGTLYLVEEAFRLGLNRFTGWDLTHVLDPEPYRLAARIFKRGVAVSGESPQSASGQYQLHVRPNRLAVDDILPQDAGILADRNLADLWKLDGRKNVRSFAVTEATKNLETVADMIPAVKSMASEAKPIYLVGGGAFCDTAAFALGLLGHPFILVPTTLLAMIDACVGGKTGVNFAPYGKNQLGLFAFPQEVMVWTGWLKTLDERQFKAGLAEAVKHSLLVPSSENRNWLAGVKKKEDLEPRLLELIQVKAEVVAQDPGEEGLRATLNLGHTFGHAIEAVSHKRGREPILHGEAVAVGLLFQALLGESLGYLSSHDRLEIFKILKDLDLLASKQELSHYLGSHNLDEDSLWDAFVDALQQDKKNDQIHASQWILLRKLGEVVQKSPGSYTVSIPNQQVRPIWQQLLTMLD